jgi:hypothetical protein
VAILRRLGAGLDNLTDRALLLLIFLPLSVVYLATAQHHPPIHIDPLTNVLTAWKLGTHGTVYLDEYAAIEGPEFLGKLNWLVRGKGRAVSKYPVGAALLAAPIYRFSPDRLPTELIYNNEGNVRPVSLMMPSLTVAAIVASATTAAAVGALVLVVRSLTSTMVASSFGLVMGLGTGLWSVAADALWQHGPAVMWLMFGLLAMSKERDVWAGAAFAMAILTRPQTAVIAALAGIGAAWGRRSVSTLAKLGLTSSLGLAAYPVFNLFVFGTALPEVAGGYFVEGVSRSGLGSTVANIGLALVDADRGLLVWSPFLVVLLFGVRAGWRAAPTWVRGAALGGVLYLVLQMRGNLWHGGGAFFAYRYPIEMMAAAAPLLALAWVEWTRRRTLGLWLLAAMSLGSVAIHGLGPALLPLW